MDIDREYWNSVKRPEVINKEYANQKYSYLKEDMVYNWRLIPNQSENTVPLYSFDTYNNHFLPNKNVHNFKWMEETPLWKKKPSFNLKPFERYQENMNLYQDKYLDTKINKVGNDNLIQNNHTQFIKQMDKRNRLLIEGVLEDTEILTRPEDKYTQHYSKFGFESYK
jgi:hypothetical protein